jgi:dihydrofolate reductase
MRKLKLEMQLSVDGFVSSSRSGWLVWDFGEHWPWDDRLRQYHIDMSAASDCILLSRKLAMGGFIDHWAEMANKTGNPQSVFAKNVAKAHKVVFTKTLDRPIWPNTELARGDLAGEVNRLKAAEGKDMIVYGGASFAAALIKANLIDEYHLVINPSILGKGVPIFDKVTRRLDLSLIEANTYGDGIVVLIYKRKY